MALKLQGLAHTLSAAGDKDLALKVYQGCGSSTKIIGALAEKGDISALVGGSTVCPRFACLELSGRSHQQRWRAGRGGGCNPLCSQALPPRDSSAPTCHCAVGTFLPSFAVLAISCAVATFFRSYLAILHPPLPSLPVME
eukprot:1150680-Pelagomonas_calceolata.AAC.2